MSGINNGDLIALQAYLSRTSPGEWIEFADGTDTFKLFNSVGTPEASIAADIGSLCVDTSVGGLYIKTTDTVNTGWVNIGSSSGDVSNGGASTDNALARFDGTTGKIIQNSLATLDDSGLLNTATLTLTNPLTVPNGGTGASTLTDHGIMLGSGTAAVTATAAPTNGQLLTGVTSGDPILLQAGWRDVNYGMIWNLSWSLSAGVLTIASKDGTALSASNPAYILMKSNATAGEWVLQTVTVNVALTVSEMTGAILGTTTSVAWASDMPLYIGVAADSTDANLEWFVTRIPNLHALPSSSTQIGDPSAPTQASLQTSAFSFVDITEANYASKVMCVMGAVFATKNSSNAWAINFAVGNFLQLGEFADDATYDMPLGQNGAAAGTYLTANGGTAPIFSTNEYEYFISRWGQVTCDLRNSGDGGTDGAGAVIATLTLPYEVPSFASLDARPLGCILSGSATGGNHTVTLYARDNTKANNAQMLENSAISSVLNSDFTNGSRFLWGRFSYTADNGGNGS